MKISDYFFDAVVEKIEKDFTSSMDEGMKKKWESNISQDVPGHKFVMSFGPLEYIGMSKKKIIATHLPKECMDFAKSIAQKYINHLILWEDNNDVGVVGHFDWYKDKFEDIYEEWASHEILAKIYQDFVLENIEELFKMPGISEERKETCRQFWLLLIDKDEESLPETWRRKVVQET